MTVTWTTDTVAAAITDATPLGKLTNAYQANWRHKQAGEQGALGPVGFCGLNDNQKGLKAAQAVVDYLQAFSAMAISSLQIAPVYNAALISNPNSVPNDPGAENPNMAFKFSVSIPGIAKSMKTSVYLPAAILPEGTTTQEIGEHLEAIFNGRAQVSTEGQPDYVAAIERHLPAGYTARFIGAKSFSRR